MGFFFRSSLREDSNSVDRPPERPRTISHQSRHRGFNSIVGWCALALSSPTPHHLHSLYKLAGQEYNDRPTGIQTLAPEYSDAGYGSLTFPQLNWRMRRHFRRVEGKLRDRKQVSSIVERPAPPSEPPPSTDPYAVPSWSFIVHDFLQTFDPSRIVDLVYHGLLHVPNESNVQQVSWPIGRALDLNVWRTLLLSIERPAVYGGLSQTTVPLIVNTGASVCISPRQEDFITYAPSTVRIRDLSSSNKVSGEGMVRWSVWDKNGNLTTIEVPCYHIPTAEVRLLSPQVLLGLAGGTSVQTSADLRLCLGNGLIIVATYCPRSRLPVLQLSNSFVRKNFWADAFAYTSSDIRGVSSDNLLHMKNSNLSASQKEVLLWHYRLSHASTSWIQLLMRDR